MRNIRLEIEYDGTNYCGWQVQNSRTPTSSESQKVSSIQEIIEKTLQKILQEKIRIIGSSRTDAGVHAKAQVANFKCGSHILLSKLHEGLNALLPEDIAVTSVAQAPSDFHSRFSAKSKAYQYVILNSRHRSALLRTYAYFCRYPLDIKLMRKEARGLLGTHNFSAFCASAGKSKNQVKTIEKIGIVKRNEVITITIKANGFLYNMVRNIAGTLIDIGRGKLPEHSVKKILLSKNRKRAGPTAPAGGLTLLEVGY
jgi:tRNA pseudouridine38-40 synthase